MRHNHRTTFTLAILLMWCLFSVTPLLAQAVVPAEPDFWTRFFEMVEHVGAPWSILIVLIITAGRIIKPMSDSYIENSRARTASETALRSGYESSTTALNNQADATAKSADALIEVAQLLKTIVTNQVDRIAPGIAKIETKPEAVASRNEAVKEINTHTTATFDQLDGKLDALVERLERVENTINNMATRKEVADIVREMKNLAQPCQPGEASADPTPIAKEE